jgi:hypothetical protein
MPLRAQIEGRNVDAFAFDDASWAVLKKTYKADKLCMPCCGNNAIPKTSKLNNFFFAHARRGEGASAPETAEHIYLKTQMARAAQNCGWSVVTEAQGKTPDGIKWVADVLCTKGRAKVALEVQLSYQTTSELVSRQLSYKKSGVRAAWFAGHKRFKSKYIAPLREMPIFYLLPFEIPDEPGISGFDLSLSAFVTALLSKRIAWKAIPYAYKVEYLVDVCRRCGAEIKQVIGWSVDITHIGKTVRDMSTVLESISNSVSNSDLTEKGLNAIGKFEQLKGNASGFPYCNVCIHCGAPQSNYHVMQKQTLGRSRMDYVEFARIDSYSKHCWLHTEK